ncbi:MAG: hypothetical protein KJN93_07455 [Alphaproteobacteria bacterium]|nr:hypothetical protein [Alphaproteobacteria bacterium]NNF23187.1 hypothetical protein [Paracoccaceae bacterium]
MRWLGHAVLAIGLTLLTQIGGLAWLIALFFKRRLLAFAVIYSALSLATLAVAPSFGRVPLPCGPSGELRSQSWLYCAMHRHYVTPELRALALQFAREMDRQHPGTVTQTLDAGFPFWDEFPLLPHISHDDGRKLDLALYYTDQTGTCLPHETRSPIGYWAFEDGPSRCPPQWLSLRWDLTWLQRLWPNRPLDEERTATALRLLVNDARVSRLFVEPHLADRLGVQGARLRFQGCRAARHDDHIHIQL